MREKKSFLDLCLHAKTQCWKYIATVFALLLGLLGAGLGAGKLRAQAGEVTEGSIETSSKQATPRPPSDENLINLFQVLTPSDFAFAPGEAQVRRADDGSNSAIANGILGEGRPWIAGALGKLGFSAAQITKHLDTTGGSFVMGSTEIDRYLTQARRGSWGTTLFVERNDGIELIPAFHSEKFVQSPNGEAILMWTAVEEAVQAPLYANLFELQHDHPQELATWGFPDQASLVDSLSNGPLRAFMEYGQHEAIIAANPSWRNVSYTFAVDSVEGDIPAVRPEVIRLINSALGTNYTTVDEILPYFGDSNKLRQLNQAFRRWSFGEYGQEYNVWDAFGLSRRGQEINKPLFSSKD